VGTGFELPGRGSSEAARPTFGSVRRGYDPSEVDAFLAHVASSIHILETRSRQAARDTPHDVTDRLAKRFARVLAIQEQEADALLTEAHVEAVTMVAGARREADRIRSVARDAAERSVEEAYAFRERAAEEADHLRSDVVERRREMIERLPHIRRRLLMFLEDVEATLDSIGDPDEAEVLRAERSSTRPRPRPDPPG
jgi:DivIVA domain-containing protein